MGQGFVFDNPRGHCCDVSVELGGSDRQTFKFGLLVASVNVTMVREPMGFFMDGRAVSIDGSRIIKLDVVCCVDDEACRQFNLLAIRHVRGLSLPAGKFGLFVVHDIQATRSELGLFTKLRMGGVVDGFEQWSETRDPLEAIDGALRDLAALREIIDRGGE